jgi:hypothetical protein
MALFWAAEVSAAWVGLAAFGLRMNATALIIGFTTGMLFTRPRDQSPNMPPGRHGLVSARRAGGPPEKGDAS